MTQQSLKVIRTGLLGPQWLAAAVDDEAVAKDDMHSFVGGELPSDELEGAGGIAIVSVQPRQDVAAAASEAHIDRLGLIRAAQDDHRHARCCLCEGDSCVAGAAVDNEVLYVRVGLRAHAVQAA